MERDEKLIREWEQRYKSYRQYRTQHLITTAFATVAVVVGLAVASGEDVSPELRFVLFTAVCIVIIAYAVARYAAIRTVKVLGDRIKWLEDEAGIAEFPTTRHLRKSLPVTLVGSVIVLGFVIYLLLSHAFGGNDKDVLEQRDDMIRYAYTFRGVPYQWGGDYLKTGVDCSGFARCVLQEFGLLPEGDYDAQMLFDYYRGYTTRRLAPGNLVFFGENDSSVTHVGILIDHMQMIDVSKGDSRTRTLAAALSRNAEVRLTIIGSRTDRIAVADPFAAIAGEEYWSKVKAHDSAWSEQLLQFPLVVVGDANASGEIEVDDIAYLTGYIFSGGMPPSPVFSGDVNCSGEIDYDDVVYLIAYIFSSGDPPCSIDNTGVPDLQDSSNASSE